MIMTRWKAMSAIRHSPLNEVKENPKEKAKSFRKMVTASSESEPQKEKEDVGELIKPREKTTLAQMQLIKVVSDEAIPGTEAGLGKASQKARHTKDMIASMAVRKERKVKVRTKERKDKARLKGRQAMVSPRPMLQPRRRAERLQLPSPRRRHRRPGWS